MQRIQSHASKRIMFRLKDSDGASVIGVYNPDVPENRAFIGFAKTFYQLKLAVPEIYSHDKEMKSYLLQDLGDETLLDRLQATRTESGTPAPETLKLYSLAIKELVRFQTETSGALDLSLCYQGRNFDAQAMLSDMLYFQDNLLKALKVDFDVERLRQDFVNFAKYLSGAKASFFMYRDFQARNIMLKDEKLVFIDFQSGRLGPLQYDLASLLFQSSAQLPENLREQLLAEYLKNLPNSAHVKEDQFRQYFEPMALLRIMQALGAYAKVGMQEGKDSFKRSIPLGLKKLEAVILMPSLKIIPAYLREVLHKAANQNFEN